MYFLYSCIECIPCILYFLYAIYSTCSLYDLNYLYYLFSLKTDYLKKEKYIATHSLKYIVIFICYKDCREGMGLWDTWASTTSPYSLYFPGNQIQISMRRPHIMRFIVIGAPLPDLFGAREERFLSDPSPIINYACQ